MLRWTIFVFAGGDAALLGLICIAIISVRSLNPKRRRPVRLAMVGLGFALSLMIIGCSSLPVPIWFQSLSFVWLIVVLIKLRAQNRDPKDSGLRNQSISVRFFVHARLNLLALGRVGDRNSVPTVVDRVKNDNDRLGDRRFGHCGIE